MKEDALFCPVGQMKEDALFCSVEQMKKDVHVSLESSEAASWDGLASEVEQEQHRQEGRLASSRIYWRLLSRFLTGA